MPFPHQFNDPTRDRRKEYERADKDRAKQRIQDAADLDPTASKWRYRAVERPAIPAK